MHKWEKRAIVCGVILMLAAAAITFVLIERCGFNFERLANAVSDHDYTESIYEPGNNFTRIEISEASADIHILPSENGSCSVACDETDAISYDVQIRNETLYIARRENMEFGFRWLSVNMYTPEITLRIPDGIEEIEVTTVSGDVSIREMQVDRLEIASTSGDIDLFQMHPDSAKLQTVSGDILLMDCDAAKELDVKTTSGEVDIENFDAPQLRIVTTSGDISAVLKTGKEFSVKTVSGEVYFPDDLPKSGVFRAETVSGDINVRVK